MRILRRKMFADISKKIQEMSDTIVSEGNKYGLSDKTKKALLDYEASKVAGEKNFHKVYNKTKEAFKKSKNKYIIPIVGAATVGGIGIAIYKSKKKKKNKENS